MGEDGAMSPLSRRHLLGLAGLGAAGLAGCSGSPGPDEIDVSPTPTPTPTPTIITPDREPASGTIEFWSSHPGDSRDVELQIIADFERANPDATVKLVDAGDNYELVADRFATALTGGGLRPLPDVVVLSDVTWFPFTLDGRLSPIDDLARTVGLDVSDYVDALYADYRLDNAHYALPYARSTPLLLHREDLWDRADLPDRGPEDWAELKKWAQELKPLAASGGVVLALPTGTNYLDWILQNLVWEFEGGWSDEWRPTFTDRHTVEALTFFQGLVNDGLVGFSDDPAAEFAAGRAACTIQSTGTLGTIDRDASFGFKAAFLPGRGNCPTGGAGIGIPTGISEARRLNAMKFAAFLTGTTATVAFSQATGYMPVRKSALQDESEKQYLADNPNFRIAVEQLPQMRVQDNARVLVPGGSARIGAALDQVIAGEDVRPVMEVLQGDVQAVIDEQIKPRLKK